MRSVQDVITMLNAAAETGSGVTVLVEDFVNLTLALDSASNANLTVKVQGSISQDAPTWGSAQSATNQWDYILLKDLEDGSSLDGDVGLALTGTDDHRLFEVNVNGLRWLNLIVTAYVAGAITGKIKPFSE